MSYNQIHPTPILTLLTDFGDRDVHVGVMKGVIFQINPRVTIIDLTHQIPPQNLAIARFCLTDAYQYFPKGTVCVAVVDPGVGSTRRAIAVESTHGFLVGPDNGIFSGILCQYPAITVVELTQSQYWRTPQPSSTFHGRDIFAPVGAYLSKGVPIKQLGDVIDPASLVRLNISECQVTETAIVGCIQYIDHFGNLVSNIPENYVQGKSWCIKASGLTISGRNTYSDVAFDEVIALVGSHGWVELAINGGNAQAKLQMHIGDAIEVVFNE